MAAGSARHNRIWLELILTAQDLTCWTQALLDGALVAAEPKPCATGCCTAPASSATPLA